MDGVSSQDILNLVAVAYSTQSEGIVFARDSETESILIDYQVISYAATTYTALSSELSKSVSNGTFNSRIAFVWRNIGCIFIFSRWIVGASDIECDNLNVTIFMYVLGCYCYTPFILK